MRLDEAFHAIEIVDARRILDVGGIGVLVALADAAAALAGAFGKVGRDVALLAQNEVGELREGGAASGASSTMPHKRNPVAAVAARGTATATELAAYATPVVSSLSRQTPAFGSLAGSEGGDFVFEQRHENEFLSAGSAQLDYHAVAANITHSKPAGVSDVFDGFTVEAALKLARQYFRVTGEPGRYKVLSRDIAYHGTTMGALSITGLAAIKAPFEPLVPGAVKIQTPSSYCTVNCMPKVPKAEGR